MLAFINDHLSLPRPVGHLVTARIESPVVKTAFVTLLLILTFPYFDFVHIPSADIDNSWRIALELIQEKNLLWGEDIVFTYGPLGRWLQRYIITTSPLELFLVDSFFALNLGFVLYGFLPKPLKIWHLPVYFAFWAIINGMHGEWMHFTWFYLVVFWGLRFLAQPSPTIRLLCYLTIVCTTNFFMKVNFGLIAVVYVFSVLLVAFFIRQMNLRQLLASMALLCLLLVTGANWLQTDLIQYVVSSLQVIQGYNESQALYPQDQMRLVLLSYGTFILVLLALTVYFIKARPIQKPLNPDQCRSLFLLGWTTALCFILLKYAFTRADAGHITAFVKQTSLLFLLTVVYGREAWLRNTFLTFLLLNCTAYLVFYRPVFGSIPVNYTTMFSQKLQLITHYLHGAATQQYPVFVPTIPAPIRNRIGRQSVDMIPNDIAEVYLNGLNYSPRPTIQSYQAYNAYLDGKNRAHYLSSNAPEWVIYRYESIDGKYPLADETQTLLAVLQRYQVAYQTPRQLYLRKTGRTRPLRLVRKKTVFVRLGETLPLATTDSLLHIVYAKPAYSFSGKLINLLFQPPQLFITLRAEDHTGVRYRAVPSLLEKGLLVNGRVDNLADARNFLNTQQVPTKRLTGLSFEPSDRWPGGFEPTVAVTIRSYRLE
ncbi:hypothetical protein ACO2Q8_08475 [Larkinella sp. VNQ87]|uniref:hypothetical protein n=1 Tax=Larkinella sp. VNQ87 TaxID=3400921 RepID=UPI003BFB6F44